MEYPEVWKITKEENLSPDICLHTIEFRSLLKRPHYARASVCRNYGYLSVRDWWKKIRGAYESQVVSEREIIFGGTQGIRVIVGNGATCKNVYLPKDKLVYSIGRCYGHGVSNPACLFDEILCTFRFID